MTSRLPLFVVYGETELHRWPPAWSDDLLPTRDWRRSHQLPRCLRWLDRF